MPKQSSYKQGTFCWADLATSDANAAKKFYGGLFGWTFDDQPAGPDMTYTMCKLGSDDAAALYPIGPQMKGVPPHWGSYISVDDVDAVTKKVPENGGKVMMEPMDVMDAGRMSMIQDPTGATVGLWQKKKHFGATVTHDPGAMTWNELFTSNVDAAGKFYVRTLGWATEGVDMGPMGTYTLFSRPGDSVVGSSPDGSSKQKQGNIGGMMAIPPHMKGVPSHWLVYFAVSDCDASAKKVSALGGKVVMDPSDIPNIGRFAIVQDPQGATFAIYKNAH